MTYWRPPLRAMTMASEARVNLFKGMHRRSGVLRTYAPSGLLKNLLRRWLMIWQARLRSLTGTIIL